MISCIVGKKGEGKTKHMLETVHMRQQKSTGNVIYIDKNTKRMYELDKSIRLINMSDYGLDSTKMFLGFICGLLSGNHDTEVIFLDSFLTIASCEVAELPEVFTQLERISEKFSVDFVLSISADKSELPEEIHKDIYISL